jgi:acetolactate synthase-1/2/3 large subunit
VAIHADARLALETLHTAMEEIGYRPNRDRVNALVAGRAAAIAAARRDAEAAMATGKMPLKGKSIVHEVNRVFGENTILVKENGGQDLWVYYWPYYQVLDAGCVVPPAEQTAMGYGVVGAIAAKLARPDRQVVCTVGDGAFQMAIHELATAAQFKLPVTWVVLNDGALGWVQWIQRRQLGGRIVATSFEPAIDIVAIACASGCDAVRVASAAELGPALERARQANAAGIPFVVDVPVDQAHHHAEFDAFHGFVPAPDSARA